MKIAILAPSPVPFVMGGAEHLWLGLQRYINEQTPHDCELLKIPSREGSLLELVQSYRLHARADVAHFDRLISTKYPAWMATHPNHVVYLQHTLRGLYDTYHFSQQQEEVDWPNGTQDIQLAIESLGSTGTLGNSAVLRLLDLLEGGLTSGRLDPEFARFPGPFARRVVHALDRYALAPGRIRQHTAISRTVADRKDYFPQNADVGVIHHPPRLEGLRCGRDDHLFTISRLDGAKRIGLLIEAMRFVRTDIPLLIGGEGPDGQRLRDLARGDPRIRFLGKMSDAQVLDAYADALAVPFVPYDEDLGLITLEAMMSGKPVLTVDDAGGVTEFVEHGVTGLQVRPDPAALGAAIEQLCADRYATRQMGQQARDRVAGISWRNVAERLIGEPLPPPRTATTVAFSGFAARPRIVVALTFAVDPPRGGGQSRVYHLYRQLASQMDVTLVCLAGPDETPRRKTLAPGLTEVRIPKTAAHQHAETEASRGVDWVPVTDIVAAREIHRTPAFLEALDAAAADADAVVASHPFFATTLRQRHPDKQLWFEAHNVEIELKREMLPDNDAARSLLELVRECEEVAWREARVVYACAQRDLDTMLELYGPSAARLLEVPNGYAEDEVVRVHPERRKRLKQELGLDERPLAIFLGSWHGPNLEAVERIVEWATTLPSMHFAIVGSAVDYFAQRAFPPNVHRVGVVDNAEKQVLLAAADLALNPMTSGSGSNLKMLDYFAAGVPVMSTRFGARGIDVEAERHYIETEIDDFPFALLRFCVEQRNLTSMIDAADALSRNRYGWKTIGQTAATALLDAINTDISSQVGT